MAQLSFMAAIDAALPYGTPCGNWWWHRWQPGDILPPGWRPPVPGADYPKPRRPAGSPPGIACEDDVIEMEISKAVDAWRPPAMASPFVGTHETRRLVGGGVWACLEAFDGGLSHVTVRDGFLTWEHVPGAGALVPREGTTEWTRLPARESWDEETQDWGPITNWADTWRVGDAIPPGLSPPDPLFGVLPCYWSFYPSGTADPEIACDVWEAIQASLPPDVWFPFTGVHETRLLADGGKWACLGAIHDGGLSHVVLRDGALSWAEAPGAGKLIWAEGTRTWVRLPAKETWDENWENWAPKDTAPAPAVTLHSVDVEALETVPALADVEPPAPAVIAPEPPAPVAAPLPSGGIQAFLHAHNLATNEGWKALAETLDRTTPGDVRNAVARHVAAGSLSSVNAALLLDRVGIAHPEMPAEAVAPEPEPPEPSDVDQLDGTVAVPQATADFMVRLREKQAALRAARAAAFCPRRALLEAGLATPPRRGEHRIELLPPASAEVTFERRNALFPNEAYHLKLLDNRFADSPHVRRIEEITRLKAEPAFVPLTRYTRNDIVSPASSDREDGW